MALISKTREENEAAGADIPPLENGDRLTRQEFERRWDLHPEVKKAELIDGQVYLRMTVSRRHGKPHNRISTWIGVYESRTTGVEALTDTTVRLSSSDDDLQPDMLLRREEGGTSRVGEDECIEGPPEFAVEVAASSASYDLHRKSELYRRAGVQEYMVWQVFEKRIDWWELQDGDYVSLAVDERGVIESKVFPGLRLNVAAMLAGEMATVLSALGSSASA
jgi:Uma2 family endonuclease